MSAITTVARLSGAPSAIAAPPVVVEQHDDADRVLIVDDERTVREVFRRTLLLNGFAATVAAGAIEGLTLLASDARITLVLLDLNMPQVSGWTFRRLQLADPRLAQVPTVIVTGERPESIRQSELQPADVLHKPFGPEVLLRVAAKYCRPMSMSR